MIIVRVYGLKDSSMDVTPLIRRIQRAIASQKELKVEPNQVAVYCLLDMCKLYRGENIFVLVDGIPPAIPSTRQALAQDIAKEVEGFAREKIRAHKLIRVIVRSLDQGDGFCKIEIPTAEGD
jgi:hypothetical protein